MATLQPTPAELLKTATAFGTPKAPVQPAVAPTPARTTMQAGNIGTQPIVLSSASTVPVPSTANIALTSATPVPTPTPTTGVTTTLPDANQGLIDKAASLYAKLSGKAVDTTTQIDTALSVSDFVGIIFCTNSVW